VLEGEDVSFVVDISADDYTAPSSILVPATAAFDVGINGGYSWSETIAGGAAHYLRTDFLLPPALAMTIDETVVEGVACPAGDADSGCNFGLDWAFLQSEVEFSSFEVDPILSAVPEAAACAQWLAGIGMLAFAAIALRRRPEERRSCWPVAG